MPLCTEKGVSAPTLQDGLLSKAPSSYLPKPWILTQKLGPGLVGAECLCLLAVLADQIEPCRASHGMAELGWDVLLDLPPGCGERGCPECPAHTLCRCSLRPSMLQAGALQKHGIFAAPQEAKYWAV